MSRGQLYIAKGGARRIEVHSAPRTLAARPRSLVTTDVGYEAAVVGVGIGCHDVTRLNLAPCRAGWNCYEPQT